MVSFLLLLLSQKAPGAINLPIFVLWQQKKKGEAEGVSPSGKTADFASAPVK